MDDDHRIDLGELPAAGILIARKLQAAGFNPDTAQTRQVLALAEEAGEFVGAYRRWAGEARRTGTFEEMADELADVVITAFVAAAVLRVDMEVVITKKWTVLHERRWRDPREGEE
jgi:NTP pyrophosphatase (non-canonical NTP hydrolase)